MCSSISRLSRKLASAASMKGRLSNTRKSRTKEKHRRNISSFNADLAESDRKHLGLKHIRTKPYTPKTKGKAERFIQTTLREWGCAHANPNSREPEAELPIWLRRYNWHRPHTGTDDKIPISRLGVTGNDVLRLDT